jgi:uncharacterized SAM-binding protein YcdF (DUF218 family)
MRLLCFRVALSNAETKGPELLQNGFAKKIICPGGNLDLNYLILFGDSIYECDITKKKILQSGVSDSSVVCIYNGTSTQEEAQAVKEYCKIHQFKSIIVVSTYFHTARVKRVYSKVFAGPVLPLLFVVQNLYITMKTNGGKAKKASSRSITNG